MHGVFVLFVLLVFPVVVTCAFFTVGCSIDRVHFFVNAQLDSDSAWDFLFCVTCAFFFYCWVLGIFFLVDSLHCMVMFILNTRDGIYNRLLCKRKKRIFGEFLPRWLCDRSINDIVFGERG